jgi:hypothetical protein
VPKSAINVKAIATIAIVIPIPALSIMVITKFSQGFS